MFTCEPNICHAKKAKQWAKVIASLNHIRQKPIFASMWELIKKGISIFTLAAMLFPMGASTVHALLHRNDFHCYEKSGKHIHLPEHHCPICDLVPPVFHSPTIALPASIEISGPITQAYFYKSVLIKARAYHFSLRAPPVYA